jgi:hypothetical protein
MSLERKFRSLKDRRNAGHVPLINCTNNIRHEQSIYWQYQNMKESVV